MKNFETTVTRNAIMKSQKYWSSNTDPERSLFVCKIGAKTKIDNSWVFLGQAVLGTLSEDVLVEYLAFLEYLLGVDGMLASVPACVQLIRIMDIFMLPTQHFLSPRVSPYLEKFLAYFSNLDFIDFKNSGISGHPSFYDFYNRFAPPQSYYHMCKSLIESKFIVI